MLEQDQKLSDDPSGKIYLQETLKLRKPRNIFKIIYSLNKPFILFGGIACVMGFATLFGNNNGRGWAGLVFLAGGTILGGLGLSLLIWSGNKINKIDTNDICKNYTTVLKELQDALRNSDTDNRLMALFILKGYQSNDLIINLQEELVENLNNSNESVSKEAVKILWSKLAWLPMTPDQAKKFIPVVIKMKDYDKHFADKIVNQPNIYVAGLVELLGSNNQDNYASWKLKTLRKSAIPPLLETLKTPVADIKKTRVLKIIGEMGLNGIAAIPELRQMLSDGLLPQTECDSTLKLLEAAKEKNAVVNKE